MSLPLHDLLVCCRGLENDKATERKVNKHGNNAQAAKLANKTLSPLIFPHSVSPERSGALQAAHSIQRGHTGIGSHLRDQS